VFKTTPKIVSFPVKTLAVRAAFWPTAAAAQELPGSNTPDLWSSGLKMMAGLAIILALLFLALYLLKRLPQSRSSRLGPQAGLRVIGTRGLGPKKYIALVEVGGSVLILGVTNEHITRLDKIPADRFWEDQNATRATMDMQGGFGARLKHMVGRPGSAGEDGS
jgi:flagellar protein FliO/FliZ